MENIISIQLSVKEALNALNNLPKRMSLTLFVVDDDQKVLGTLTDGDIRRGLLNGVTLEDNVGRIMNKNFTSLSQYKFRISQIKAIKKANIKLLPIIDEQGRIARLVDFTEKESLLPVDVVIMAGGEGVRLRPLTENIPKPLLPVGGKAIIEHNIDRLSKYGAEHFIITVRYLGQQIKDHLGNGTQKNISIDYIDETDPLGTIGALSRIDGFRHDNILLMNSDLLTTIDFEDFYEKFEESGADLCIASIPYQINVPYAILQLNDQSFISDIREKPTYIYQINAGIYLMKQSVLQYIPANGKFDAPELAQALIDCGKKVTNFEMLGYWLDIGRHEDYKKAQEDIHQLHL